MAIVIKPTKENYDLYLMEAVNFNVCLAVMGDKTGLDGAVGLYGLGGRRVVALKVQDFERKKSEQKVQMQESEI